MTEARWRQIERVFNEALEVPEAEREQWLLRTCAGDEELLREVRSLLANDSANAETLASSVKEAITALPQARAAVKRAGPYELIDELGRGGMGTVYRARRADKAYEAVVAVKLVRPGMDTDFVLSRFRQERQTLAKLNHPNIARLLDGGTTSDGVPYIVMEYIDGVRINEYCRREKLTVEQRLRLMLPVCLATDHAHRNFVVHRDIKPGNILVDSTGTPKLLDFGICKLLHANSLEDEMTVTREMGMLTPDYASPEQVLGESISARSDVYSLGAVLYELLTGVKPHRFEKLNLLAIEDVICNTPVAAPSQVASSDTARYLRGDLDNIAMRALEKDPRLRYESAAALADDIRRYLDQEPVAARPAGTLYRAGKFIRRHRALTGAVAAVLIASATGTFVSVRQARRAEARERDLRSLARIFLYDVHDSVRDLPGATGARQKIVKTAVEYLSALAGSNPSDPDLLRELASGYQRIADLQGSDARGANLGDTRAALASYSKAVEYWDRLLAGHPDDTPAARERLESLRRSADLRTQLDGQRAALPIYRRVEDEARGLLARSPDDERSQSLLADILTVSARRSRESGDLSDSRRKAEEALSLATNLADRSPKDRVRATAVASAESALGMALSRLGDLRAAAKLYGSSVARGEKTIEADPSNISAKRNLMIGYSHLGDILGNPEMANLGEPQACEATYSKMVAIARQLAASDPKDARAATDLAIALSRWAVVTPSPAERERKLGESLGILLNRLQASPASVTLLGYHAYVRYQLGLVSEAAGDRLEALAHWKAAFDIAAPHGAKSETLAKAQVLATRELALYESAHELRRQGPARLAAALSLAEKASERAKAPDDVAPRAQLARVYSAHSIHFARTGDAGQAAAWRERALQTWKEIAGRPGFIEMYRKELQRFEGWRP